MPYILKELRPDLQEAAFEAGNRCTTPGHLNFVITMAVLAYMDGEHRYTKLNEVIGVLECCKQELYRRLGSKIEDDAIARNGDVY